MNKKYPDSKIENQPNPKIETNNKQRFWERPFVVIFLLLLGLTYAFGIPTLGTFLLTESLTPEELSQLSDNERIRTTLGELIIWIVLFLVFNSPFVLYTMQKDTPSEMSSNESKMNS